MARRRRPAENKAAADRANRVNHNKNPQTVRQSLPPPRQARGKRWRRLVNVFSSKILDNFDSFELFLLHLSTCYFFSYRVFIYLRNKERNCGNYNYYLPVRNIKISDMLLVRDTRISAKFGASDYCIIVVYRCFNRGMMNNSLSRKVIISLKRLSIIALPYRI